jgi:stage V sporulation protein G
VKCEHSAHLRGNRQEWLSKPRIFFDGVQANRHEAKGIEKAAMDITEVRIKLMEDSEDRLRAFCSITLDHCFVIRDLKIIEGSNGPFVAMPSRKMTARCGKCGNKNHMRSHYCNQCGARLRGPQDVREPEGAGSGSNKLYADIAHPINQTCRDLIQNSVVREYSAELERAKQPGYKSRYDDEYLDAVAQPASSVAPIHSPTDLPNILGASQVSEAAVPRPHMLDDRNHSVPSERKEDKPSFGDGIF